MELEEVLEEYCKLQGLVYHSLENYSSPSDGFCRKCPNGVGGLTDNFRHSGETIKYIRDAVLEKLAKDSRVKVGVLEAQLKWYKASPSYLPEDEEDNELEGAD